MTLSPPFHSLSSYIYLPISFSPLSLASPLFSPTHAGPMSLLTFPAAFKAWQTPASALHIHTCFPSSLPLYYQEEVQHT